MSQTYRILSPVTAKYLQAVAGVGEQTLGVFEDLGDGIYLITMYPHRRHDPRNAALLALWTALDDAEVRLECFTLGKHDD